MNDKNKMAEQFSLIVQKGLYDDADEMLSQLKDTVNPDDYLSEDLCITAAFLYNKLGKRKEELYYLQQGFLINPVSPALFISLGDYYAKSNVQQELICLYQALFYARKYWPEEQIGFIEEIIGAFEKNGASVPKTSFVILSYNTKDYISQCLESIKETVPLDRCQVIVVDNASTDGSVEYLRTLDWIMLVENKENRGFPGGCNDGIAAADNDNDIYLLNSDTILPANGLFWLKIGLYENDRVGSTGSVTNFATNGQAVYDDSWKTLDDYISYGVKNNVPMEYPYQYKTLLIGFSLLLKRRVLNEVGQLDEVFYPGNGEDVDLGFRFLMKGKLNVLCLNSFVFHYGNKSFDQLQIQGQKYNELLDKNEGKLHEKLGFNPWPCHHYRRDLVEEITADRDTPLHILEIGGGIGASASLIISQFPNSVYTGIEKNKAVTPYLQAFGDVITGDAEQIDFDEYFEKDYFDYVILGDVLECFHNPAEMLKKLAPYLKKRGRLIISVPNIRHWSVVLPLLNEDRFIYSDDGIVSNDSVHLFTENDAARLISGNGYSIRNMKHNIAGELEEEDRKELQALSRLCEQPDINDFLVKQYIFTAEKSNG